MPLSMASFMMFIGIEISGLGAKDAPAEWFYPLIHAGRMGHTRYLDQAAPRARTSALCRPSAQLWQYRYSCRNSSITYLLHYPAPGIWNKSVCLSIFYHVVFIGSG